MLWVPLRVLPHGHRDGRLAVLRAGDVGALACFALCLLCCLLLFPFEVLLYQFVLLELLLLLLLREVREHSGQVQVRHVRRSADNRARPAAGRLALASFEVLVQIVYFLEDLVVVGEALLLHEAVGALALIN